MSKVALVKCSNYDDDIVKIAIAHGVQLLGGLDAFVQPNEKILLKPNLLVADSHEKASVTHPSVVKALAQVLLEKKPILTYGDSPAFHKPSAAAEKSGMHHAMSALGIRLAGFENGRDVVFEEGIQNKKFYFASGALDADGIIGISKLKTHGLTRLTGAIKNQFGCVPGTRKAEFHAKIPDPNNFSKMIVDITRYLKPRLYVMDGIVAMQGKGPRGGEPRSLGVLLFSTDPVALDATACRIIGLSPDFVPTNVFGKDAGLGTWLEDEIEIVGAPISDFYVPDFDMQNHPIELKPPLFLVKWIKKFLVQKPKILREKCIKCGLCVRVCPVTPRAISQKPSSSSQDKNIPKYDYSRCIRCFCCQELCPEGAIDIVSPMIRKIFEKKKIRA